MISIDEARHRILHRVERLEAETVGLDAALGRVLAAPVRPAAPVPPFAGSAMDGYAVRLARAGAVLELAGEARAGAPAAVGPTPGRAVRISTGAAVPPGTEAVIRQEDVRVLAPDRIELRTDAVAGANIRTPGEDMPAGEPVLAAGTILGPAELAVAAAAGAGRLEVTRQPRAHILCTGDELRAPGSALAPGQIYNSNGPMLRAFAARAGAAVGDPQEVPDTAEATARALAGGLDEAELLIVSGGVSVGPHDHVKPELERLGVREEFWRVALQPGKPTWFGRRGPVLVFGLPGNPVSTAVTFALFVAPAIRAMLGADPGPVRACGRLTEPVRRNPERLQAMRVGLTLTADGVCARPTGPQGSHRTVSLLGAGALALIPAGDGELGAGEIVELLLLSG